MVIISDANSVFIEHVLEAQALQVSHSHHIWLGVTLCLLQILCVLTLYHVLFLCLLVSCVGV